MSCFALRKDAPVNTAGDDTFAICCSGRCQAHGLRVVFWWCSGLYHACCLWGAVCTHRLWHWDILVPLTSSHQNVPVSESVSADDSPEAAGNVHYTIRRQYGGHRLGSAHYNTHAAFAAKTSLS